MRIVDPTLAVWTYELVTRDGMKVVFTDHPGYQYDTFGGRYATYAEFSNGDFIAFNYAASPTVAGTMRLTRVYNSRGYGFDFNYQTRAKYFQTTMTDSSLITSVTAFKQTSSGQTNLSSVNYTYDQTNYVVASFQNNAGKTYRYSYDQGRPTGLYVPNNLTSIPSISFEYFDGYSQVTSFTTSNAAGTFYLLSGGAQDSVRDVQWSAPRAVIDAMGNKTLFEFSDVTQPDPISVTIRRPGGGADFYSTVYCDGSPPCQLPANFSRNPTFYQDGALGIWRYRYDNLGRPISTEGDGILQSQIRDANGNIVESRIKARPGSGQPDIVSTAGYEPCNSANYKYCNKPIFSIDPALKRWDFQYAAGSGNLMVSLAPADSQGVRAVTRYYYGTSAYAAVPLPYLFQGSGVTLLTAKDTCLSSPVLGNSVDFSFVCGAGNRTRVTYGYIPSTVTSPSSSELATVVNDADQAAASTAFAYDMSGNVTSVTDAMGYNSFTTYDQLRRKVFEIGPDPDGGGSQKRQMVRHIYDDNGNEIRTETGIGAQVDGSDFEIVRFQRKTYDLNDKLVKVEDVIP